MTRNHLSHRGGRRLGGRRTRASVMAALAAGSIAGRRCTGRRRDRRRCPGADPTMAAPAAPAPAVGKLTPSGCTGTGTHAVSCDLYAMTGTATLLGRSIPIWGFSVHRRAPARHGSRSGARGQPGRHRHHHAAQPAVRRTSRWRFPVRPAIGSA